MAIKNRYCEHEPTTKIFRRSKSSRLYCCDACYYKEVRKDCVEMFGEEFVVFLDNIKKLDVKKYLIND
jgi:hypothetical protein